MRPAPGVLHAALYRGHWLVGAEAVEPARVREGQGQCQHRDPGTPFPVF